MHTRWGGPAPIPADPAHHPEAASSGDPQPAAARATKASSSGETNFADLLNRHNMPRGTYPPTESTQPAADTEPPQPTKAQTYYPYWDPRGSQARPRNSNDPAPRTQPHHNHWGTGQERHPPSGQAATTPQAGAGGVPQAGPGSSNDPVPPAQPANAQPGADTWWQPNDQAASTHHQDSHSAHTHFTQPSPATPYESPTSKQATAGEVAYQQRSRESPYERWNREYQERQAAAANQDWWGSSRGQSQATATEWRPQQWDDSGSNPPRPQTNQQAAAATEPGWKEGTQQRTQHHTGADDTRPTQQWQPATWQHDSGSSHQPGGAAQPHTHHHAGSEAPTADSWQPTSWQDNSGGPQQTQTWDTTQTQQSSSSHMQAGGEPRPLNTDPLWDGRTLRLSARTQGDANPSPAPWVNQVRDGRRIGRHGGSTPQQAPTPGPPPTQQHEHTDLMQRHSSVTAAQQALQAANRRGETQAMALQQQIQLIHDLAEHVGGEPGAAITTLCDVLARQVALLAPTGALPETCKTSRKRALTEPNVLVEALSLTSRFSFSGGASLTSEERAWDMAFLIRVLEMGESQLLEPMPAAVGEHDVQQALQGLRRAREIATELRDRALRGEPWWDLPIDLWEQLRRNTAPAAYHLERRGEAFADEPQTHSRGVRPRLQEAARGSSDPAPHPPLENTAAATSGEGSAMVPAPTTTTAFLLLHEAAQAFRGLIPQLGDGHATIATQLLHAVDHAWRAVSGEATAVHDLTQTLEAGDSQETVPALQGEQEADLGDAADALPAPQVTQHDTETVDAPPHRGEHLDSSLGSDMPGTETEDEAFGLDRRRRTPVTNGGPPPTGWTTLVGITPSQAAPHITASLEEDVRALGRSTQNSETEVNEQAGGHSPNLPPTLPWAEQWHTQMAGGDSADLETFYQSELSAESEGEASVMPTTVDAGFMQRGLTDSLSPS